MIKIIVQTSKMQCERDLPDGCVCTISTMDDKDILVNIFKPQKRPKIVKVKKTKRYNKKKINISLDTQSEMIKDYSSGMTLRDMEKKYKISHSTIRRLLKSIGVYGERIPLKRKNDAIYDPKIRAEIIEMYQFGLSMEQISNEKALPSSVVSKIIKAEGIPVRTYSEAYRERVKERNTKIIEAYKSGMTWQEISETFGVAKMTISNILKKSGVVMRRN